MITRPHQVRLLLLLAFVSYALPNSHSLRREGTPRPKKQQARLGFEEIIFKKVYSRQDVPKTPSKANITRLARTPRSRGKREEASVDSRREKIAEGSKPAAATSSKVGSKTVRFLNVSKATRVQGASARRPKKDKKRCRSDNSQMNSESNLMLSEGETEFKSEFTEAEDSQNVFDSCRDPDVDNGFLPLLNNTAEACGASVRWEEPNATELEDDEETHGRGEQAEESSLAPSTADPSDDVLVADEEEHATERPSGPSSLTRMGLGFLRLIRKSVLGELSPVRGSGDSVSQSPSPVKPREELSDAEDVSMLPRPSEPENMTMNNLALSRVGGLFNNIVSYLSKNHSESRKEIVVHETEREAQEKKIVQKTSIEEPSYISIKIQDEGKNDGEFSELKIFPICERNSGNSKRNVKCVVDEGVPGTPFGSKIVRVVGVRPSSYRLFNDDEVRRRSERESDRKQAFKLFGGISKKARFSKSKKTGISWFWGSQNPDKNTKTKYNYSNMLKGSIRSSSNAKRGAVYNSKIWERPQSASNMSPFGSSFKQHVVEAQETLGFNPLTSQPRDLSGASARESPKKGEADLREKGEAHRRRPGSTSLNESPGEESKLLGQNKLARAEMLGF